MKPRRLWDPLLLFHFNVFDSDGWWIFWCKFTLKVVKKSYFTPHETLWYVMFRIVTRVNDLSASDSFDFDRVTRNERKHKRVRDNELPNIDSFPRETMLITVVGFSYAGDTIPERDTVKIPGRFLITQRPFFPATFRFSASFSIDSRRIR